jgi:hypothetical protein
MYHAGEGVEKDAVQALNWYRKAAVQGVAAAQCNLGSMYARVFSRTYTKQRGGGERRRIREMVLRIREMVLRIREMVLRIREMELRVTPSLS